MALKSRDDESYECPQDHGSTDALSESLMHLLGRQLAQEHQDRKFRQAKNQDIEQFSGICSLHAA